MKTLLERAKPELIAGFEVDRKNVPSLVERAEKWLSKNCFANEITWDLWIDLSGFWFKATGKFPAHPWEIFEND